MKVINVHRLSLQFDEGALPGDSERQVAKALILINEVLAEQLPYLSPQLFAARDEIEVEVSDPEEG